MKRNAITSILFVMVIVVSTHMPLTAQNVGDMAPDFTFTRLNGTDLSLSDYPGKIIFLYLLGNGCPFCLAVGNRTEVEVHQAFMGTGQVQAIGLDLWDSSSSTTTLGSFQQQTGITYPLCLMAGSMASLYQTTYDRAIVIDQNRIIRFKGNARVSNDLNDAVAVINSLLETTDVGDDPPGTPVRFSLSQNYPNPFNPETTIRFGIENATHVSLKIYDVLGNEIAVLVDGEYSPGTHEVAFNAQAGAGTGGVPSGIYFYRIETNDYTAVRKMIIQE